MTQFNASQDGAVAFAIGSVEGVIPFSSFGVVDNLTADVESDVAVNIVTDISIPDLAGEEMTIVSTDAADTDTINIHALGPEGVFVEPFDVVLTGTTPVVIGVFSRINSASSVGVDGYDGIVTIGPTGGGATYLSLLPDFQQSSQALYTVPKGSRVTVSAVVGTMQKSGGADTDAVMNILIKGAAQTKWKKPFGFGMQRSGDTSIEFQNNYPSAIDGPLDIKLRARSSATGASVAGWFSGLKISKGSTS